MRVRHVVLACGLLLLSVWRDEAAGAEPFSKVGTYGFQFANMPRGVRNLGMGSTGTASLYEHSTGYFNPASLAWTDAWTLQSSHEEWPAEISLTDIRVSGAHQRISSQAATWRFGGSLGYTGLWMEPQVVRTIFLPDGTDEVFDADDHMLTATAAAAWEHGMISLGTGGTAKYILSGLAAGDVSTWALDAGALLAFPIAWNGALLRPRAGVAMLNLDSGAEYDGRTSHIDNETRTALGVDIASPLTSIGGGAWRRDVAGLMLSFDYDWSNRDAGTDRESYGLAASFFGTLEARIGRVTVEDGREETRYGTGLGWDFGHWLFQFDYAHLDESSFLNLDRDSFGLLVGARWAP